MGNKIYKIAAENARLLDGWRTPRWLFDKLNGVFDFDFDMCASDENHLCSNYFTASDDAATAQLPENARSIFCNPPFSGKTKQKILERASDIVHSGRKIVFVLSANLSDTFFYDLIHRSADRVLVINGEIGLMIVVFDGSSEIEFDRAWGLCKTKINFITHKDLLDTEIAELNEMLAPSGVNLWG